MIRMTSKCVSKEISVYSVQFGLIEIWILRRLSVKFEKKKNTVRTLIYFIVNWHMLKTIQWKSHSQNTRNNVFGFFVPKAGLLEFHGGDCAKVKKFAFDISETWFSIFCLELFFLYFWLHQYSDWNISYGIYRLKCVVHAIFGVQIL